MNAPCCRLLLAALCAVACLLRVAPWFAARLDDGNDEPLGIVPLAAALCFLWREGRTLPEITPVRLALVFIGTTAVFLLPLPPMLRALTALGVLTVAARVRQPAIVGLLSLSLPVMASLQFYAGYPLRWLTASGSHALLSACGVTCQRTGTILTTPDGVVGVDAPCSGIRMWWTACVLALVLMAQMRLSTRAVITGLVATTALVIAGNVLRATILYLPESGTVHWPPWTHEGTGAILFAVCTWMLIRVLDRLRGARPGRLIPFATLLAGAALAVVAKGAWQSRPITGTLPPLPGMFEGLPLVPVPPGMKEAAFAKDFPGRLSVFLQGERHVLWREVLQPTRSLHSSLDCLRAAGWTVKELPILTDADGLQWGTAEATGPDGRRHVRERIIDTSGRAWTDVSSWWWAATFGATQGPWTAITVVEP